MTECNDKKYYEIGNKDNYMAAIFYLIIHCCLFTQHLYLILIYLLHLFVLFKFVKCLLHCTDIYNYCSFNELIYVKRCEHYVYMCYIK